MARSNSKSRRRWRRPLLILLLLALLLGAGAFYQSNFILFTESYTFTSSRLPEAFDGFRIVQLSDLHGAVFGQDNQDLLEAVEAAEPDLIAITGDIVDRHRNTPFSYAWELGAQLAAIAPTYFITGNHEWGIGRVPELKEGLEAAGVTVLSNQYVALERSGQQIVLARIDDPNGYADQKTPEELAAEVRSAFGEDVFWLLLAHRNTYFEKQYSLLGADLVLSGHGHGGLIRLPFTDGLLSTERTLFPSYTSGFYEANGAQVFISRGIGNSGISFRLFNPAQLVVMTLERG